MKIVIKRHAGDYQVFRAAAIAQAAAAANPGAKIFIECFDIHARVLKLFPSLTWKNPHHPYEVGPRHDLDRKELRPGQKLYDQVIDLDPESRLELDFTKSGLPWWDYILQAKVAGAGGKKLTPARFPELEEVKSPYTVPPVPYVVLAPLSTIANPHAINANQLEVWARAKFPGKEMAWISPENTFLGDNRNIARYDGFVSLAGILAGAHAVVSVSGIVSGLAQSTWKGQRLVRRYVHVRSAALEGRQNRDIFLKFASLIETELERGKDEPACGIVTTKGPQLDIQEIQPLPED